PDEHVEAAAVQPAHARAGRKAQPLRRPATAAGEDAALAPVPPWPVLRAASAAAGALAQQQGRPGGDALVGGDPAAVSGRKGLLVPGPSAPPLEAARPARQVFAPLPGRALAAAAGSLARQGDVPRPARQLPRDRIAAVRGAVVERGIAAQDGLFRSRGGTALAAGVPADGAAVAAADVDRDGAGRRGGDAVVAPHV